MSVERVEQTTYSRVFKLFLIGLIAQEILVEATLHFSQQRILFSRADRALSVREQAVHRRDVPDEKPGNKYGAQYEADSDAANDCFCGARSPVWSCPHYIPIPLKMV